MKLFNSTINVMIISHKLKFIFICNGKTGTTSIEKALKPFDESCDMNHGAPGLWASKHIPPAAIKSFLPSDIWDQYFKFVFVRHPLDWFVSQYKHNFRKPRFSKRAILQHPIQAFNQLRKDHNEKEVTSKQVFDREDVDFLYQHLRSYRGLPLSQSLLQSNYVYDADGKVMVDFIGRFENLVHDVQKVTAQIGIDFKLPHLNKTAHQPYQACFTEPAIERVQTLWDADFKNFGYRVNPVELGQLPPSPTAPHSLR